MVHSQFHFIADFLLDSSETSTEDTNLLENALQKLTDLSKDSIHLTPLTIAPLIRLITTASAPLVGHFLSTTLKVILDGDNKDHASEHLAFISDRIALGIKAFLARGGGTSKSSRSTPTNSEGCTGDDVAEPPAKKRRKIPTSSRSSQQRSRCWARDRKICVVTSSPDNLEVAHILPFSLGVAKGSRSSSSGAARTPVDQYFWDFVGMFLGPDNTAKLKSRFEQLDVVENMLLVDPNVHKYFGAGRLCLIPQLTFDDELSFHPSTTLEYNATIDFPSHPSRGIPTLAKSPSLPTSRTIERILAGDTTTIKTESPSTHPLPHPALLGLHAIISRIIAARGGADVVPPVPNDDDDLLDGLYKEYSGSEGDGDDSRSERSWVDEWISTGKERSLPSSPPTDQPELIKLDEERARPVGVVLGELGKREVERWALRECR